MKFNSSLKIYTTDYFNNQVKCEINYISQKVSFIPHIWEMLQILETKGNEVLFIHHFKITWYVFLVTMMVIYSYERKVKHLKHRPQLYTVCNFLVGAKGSKV